MFRIFNAFPEERQKVSTLFEGTNWTNSGKNPPIPPFKKPVKKNILLFVPYIAIFFVVSFTQAFQSAEKGEANL